MEFEDIKRIETEEELITCFDTFREELTPQLRSLQELLELDVTDEPNMANHASELDTYRATLSEKIPLSILLLARAKYLYGLSREHGGVNPYAAGPIWRGFRDAKIADYAAFHQWLKAKHDAVKERINLVKVLLKNLPRE